MATGKIRSGLLLQKLIDSGYTIPANREAAQISFSKLTTSVTWGTPRLTQIDSIGSPIEEWSLRNAWVESVDFGNLDYSSEEMVNITMSWRYDYAEYSGNPPVAEGASSLTPVLNGGTA